LLASIDERVRQAGLALRGVFHPNSADGVPSSVDDRPARTLVLVGWTGRFGFDAFNVSPEAADGKPHPLDRWSKRVIDALAEAFGAWPLYPFGGPPYHPFQRWAERADQVSPSPLGLLIHPCWGLWHSYRGALAFASHLAFEPQEARPSPCKSCMGRPCLSACPVGAFTPGSYDAAACADHLRTPAGRECLARGCLARRACPVGREHAYDEAQARFHMRAFLAARA
jgi:hypothetical protein